MNLKKAFHHEEHEGHEDFPWGILWANQPIAGAGADFAIPEVA